MKTKVTTEALRAMAMGETATFAGLGAEDINSGKAIAYRAGHILGCKFQAQSDFANNTLTLTKLPR